MITMSSRLRVCAIAHYSILALLLASPLALADTLPLFINLADAPGEEGARLTRSYAGAGDGFAAGNQSVAVADFNADGFDDIVVGYGNYAPPGSGGSSRGRVIIEFGGETPAEQNLEEAAGNVIITNVDDNAQFGYAVAAGDVNDDGRTDLVIGAPGARTGKGVVVILENSTLVNPGYSVTTDGANPTSNETRYVGTEEAAGLGYAVACADLNDDGAAEIIAGEPRATVGGNADSGRVLVGFGPNYAAGMTMDFQMEPELYEIQGGTNMQLGSAVTTGDFNGDGRRDLLIGAPATSEPTGAAYVFFDVSPGPSTAAVTDSGVLSTILRLHGFAALGFALDAGDVDKDGFDDILVGMPLYSPDIDRNQAGGAVLYAGRSTLAGTNINLTSSLESSKVTRYDGGQAIDRAGGSVALGDINADGILDIVIGQPFAKGAEDAVGNYGRIAIYSSYGKLSAGYSIIDLFSNGPDVSIFGGGSSDFLGATANLGADIDRDGYADLVTSAGFAPNPGASGTGNVFTLYGDGTADSAQAVESFGSGTTQRTGFAGALSPVLGASIEFDGGTSGTATAQITRSNATISDLGNGALTNVAKVLWNLSTTRTLWTKAILNLDYTDAQVVGFGDTNLGLYQAAAPAGPWTELTGATIDTTANRVSAEVSTLGYFALMSNQPVVSLNGSSQMTLECKDEWSEPGYIATAANGDDLSDLVVVGGETIDPTQLGATFTITYDVEDGQGNAATTVTRTVEIIDTSNPEFTNSNFRSVEAGSVYVDTFTLEDCEDLADQVVVTGDTVDTNVLGQYIRFFDVTDSSGNVAEQSQQTITVEDSTLPVITLNGSETVEVQCGGTYTELGATATDWDVNLGPVQVSGDVDTSAGGSYEIYYDVTDPSGNNAVRVVRTVTVVDTIKPVIVLSSESIEVNCGAQSFSPPFITVEDCQPNLAVDAVIGGVNAIDLNTIGSYFVTYDVSDSAGNAADQATLEVKVVDKIRPLISLIGANPLELPCETAYNDPGATATDECSGVAGAVQVDDSAVNPNVAGSYNVLYEVADNAGNIRQITRTVNVVGFCGTGVVEDCPGESEVAYLPADNTVVGQGVPSEDGLDTVFEEYYSLDNLPTTKVTWWGYGLVNGNEPCDRSTNNFRISFYETLSLQSGVFPYGPPVYYEDVVPVVESTGFTTDENSPLLRYTATLENPFRIYPDFCCAQYFISIKGMGDPCTFQWHFSKDDDNRYLIGPDSDNATIVEGKDLSLCLVQEAVAEGEGEAPPANHAADPDGNNIVDLSELVRLIQFYNADYYGCLFGSEDGYGPEADADFCGYHSSDYNPADWEINLSELLRLIQFYTYGEYHPCPGQSEDGYCPGAP